MPSSPERPHPSLNAMLLCDLTIREHGSGKISLIGVFENISAARFPVVHRALSVYAKLTDAEGDYTIRLELVPSPNLSAISSHHEDRWTRQ